MRTINVNDDQQFWLRFRGVRGGYPMPGTTTVKYGGNTTCLEVHAGPHLIIIDGGTGIIGLGREIMATRAMNDGPLLLTLLLTHIHNDHTQGLPLFGPALSANAHINFFGPRPPTGESLGETLQRIMRPPFSPIGQHDLLSRRTFTHVRQGDEIVLMDPKQPAQHVSVHAAQKSVPEDAVRIKIHHSYNHPQNGVQVFRIHYQRHSIVFATDVEGYIGDDQRLIAFTRGADLLIHDAEYDEHEYADGLVIKQGWGHSTWRMAAQVAEAAGVQRLALTHHSPQHDDAYLDRMAEKAQAVFPATFMAREGEVVKICT